MVLFVIAVIIATMVLFVVTLIIITMVLFVIALIIATLVLLMASTLQYLRAMYIKWLVGSDSIGFL